MIMEDVQKTHPGRQATETVLRTVAWWPGMSQDVEQLVSCENCQKNRPLLEKTVSKWPEADVWEQIYMAWATMKEQGNIFVVVDAGSGWIEAFPTIYRSTLAVNKYLSAVFARSGVPKL